MSGTAPSWAAALLALAASGPAAGAEVVRVFAASSLTEAFREMAAAYEQAHPGTRVELSLAGSQVLRTQIEHGAPADVFASADLVQTEALAQQGLLAAAHTFAHNALLVVAPAEGRVQTLQDLARPGTAVLMAAPQVPAGRYADEVLDRLAASGLYGGRFAEAVRRNVRSREPNVRFVLAKVAYGEADAGFVYLTDAGGPGARLRQIPIPEAYNVVATYPIAVVTRPGPRGPARSFVEFVTGTRGRAVLLRHGFQP